MSTTYTPGNYTISVTKSTGTYTFDLLAGSAPGGSGIGGLAADRLLVSWTDLPIGDYALVVPTMSGDCTLQDPDGNYLARATLGNASYTNDGYPAGVPSSSVTITGGQPGSPTAGKGSGAGSGPSLTAATNGNDASGQTGGTAPSGGFRGGNGGNIGAVGEDSPGLGAGGGGGGNADIGAEITSGLVGAWKLNEGSGTTVANSVGGGQSGTLTNGPTWSTTNGLPNVAFDGTDDYIDFGSGITLIGATPGTFSIGGWFDRSASNKTIFFGFDNTISSALCGIEVAVDGTAIIHIDDHVGANSFNKFNCSATGRTHFGMTFDGSQTGANRFKPYVNGVLQNITQTFGTFPATVTTPGNLLLARNNTNYSNIKADNVVCFTSALTASQWLQLVNNKAGGAGSNGRAIVNLGATAPGVSDGMRILMSMGLEM